jgi:N-formylglutamate amidohydrolase
MAPDLPSSSFELIAGDAAGPVILSVPHAGRDYPAELTLRLRPPVERLVSLEDRMVDAIARGVAGVATLIARRPRAWIDLNRHETEVDPGMIEDGPPASRVNLSTKVRSGLGLVPRRLSGVGELWRGKLPAAELTRRIAEDHRPYHDTIADLLARARARHGVAILVDLHSMPPLNGGAQLVVGTRFGLSAAPGFVAPVIAAATRAGFSVQENSPYAGGHIVERHGDPRRNVHAVQLELDRTLYLDRALDRCDPAGLARTQTFLRDTIGRLTEAALGPALPLAAE